MVSGHKYVLGLFGFLSFAVWFITASSGAYWYGGIYYAVLTMIVGIMISVPVYLAQRSNENSAKIRKLEKKGLEERVNELEKKLKERDEIVNTTDIEENNQKKSENS